MYVSMYTVARRLVDRGGPWGSVRLVYKPLVLICIVDLLGEKNIIPWLIISWLVMAAEHSLSEACTQQQQAPLPPAIGRRPKSKAIVASAFPFALAPTKEQGTTHHYRRRF